MNLRTITGSLVFVFLTIKCFSQTSARAIDRILTASYRELTNPASGLSTDSAAALFKRKLVGYLSSPLVLDSKLDSLATYITIVQSPDTRVKFYSWNEMTSGSWHDLNAFAQYIGTANKVLYRQIDTDKEMEDGGYTDSEIYQVHEIREGLEVYYLSFGFGTHGSGNQHGIIQVFKVDGDSLVKCKAFDDKDTELAIEFPRRYTLDLRYDEKTRAVSFNEFVHREGEQYAEKTGKRKTLVFKNGSFH